jgi:hypothetical protein
VHLFELEDQPWYPAAIRDAATDFLRFVLENGDVYAPAVPLLQDLLARYGNPQIVDLCSGGGGPWRRFLDALGPQVQVCLTDLYPNRLAWEKLRADSKGQITFYPDPVDASTTPLDLHGVRILFTALHHFPPKQARAVLADAVRHREPIAAFEFTERSLRGLLLSATSPLMVWLATPRIRPMGAARLIWTYLIPLVPLTVLVDGMISCLRTYSPQELRGLTEGLEGYTWESGVVRGRSPFAVTYLIGYPAQDA